MGSSHLLVLEWTADLFGDVTLYNTLSELHTWAQARAVRNPPQGSAMDVDPSSSSYYTGDTQHAVALQEPGNEEEAAMVMRSNMNPFSGNPVGGSRNAAARHAQWGFMFCRVAHPHDCPLAARAVRLKAAAWDKGVPRIYVKPVAPPKEKPASAKKKKTGATPAAAKHRPKKEEDEEDEEENELEEEEEEEDVKVEEEEEVQIVVKEEVDEEDGGDKDEEGTTTAIDAAAETETRPGALAGEEEECGTKRKNPDTEDNKEEPKKAKKNWDVFEFSENSSADDDHDDDEDSERR